MKLEDLQADATVRGVLPEGLATVVGVQWFGSEALELTCKSPTGKVANQLLYRHDEPQLEIVEVGRPGSFDGDGALFRLVSEAQRIRLAHLFDPVLAVHTSDVSDLMRRMVKEKLLEFDGTPLFPERIAYTVPYQLSPEEAGLYKAVTDHVRQEFNLAEALENDKRAGTVGFALTLLQRRLASSPAAIHRSLRHRRERPECVWIGRDMEKKAQRAEPYRPT